MVKLKPLATVRFLIMLFTFLFFMITVFNVFFASDSSIEKRKFHKEHTECDEWRRWIKAVRNCLLEGLTTNSAWYLLDTILSNCVDREKLRSMNIRVLTNIDDTKLAIIETEAETPCTVVTLGINKNIHGEKTLATAMPQCSFYGADPIQESGKFYKNIGEYYPFAVSNESTIANSSIKINSTLFRAEMAFLSFDEFITTMVNKTFVDILFMDVGGDEYKIFNMFFKSKLADLITVCQITVEFHGPPGLYDMTKLSYDNFVYKLIKYTPFLPLWTKEHGRHTKVYLFNTDNKRCVLKYVPHLC